MALFSNSPAALLPQPALLVGIEEGVHQIIAIVLGYFEWLRSNGLVEGLQQAAGQISAVVDATIHRYELLNGGFVFNLLWKKETESWHQI